jgi:hypothetical protein
LCETNILKNIEKTKLIIYILCMGCKKCKEKTEVRQKVEHKSDWASEAGIWVVITWSLLGLYGIVSLILDIIKWL